MPDVFILGFTKCATTSLYNQLMQHERVSQTRHKEPHFHYARIMGDRFAGPADNDTVSQMFITHRQQYNNLYQSGKLAIDGSAMSIEDPLVLESMYAEFPHARYIIMLRDPVDRAFSAYTHLIRDARESLSFRQAIDHELSGARVNHMPIWHNIKSSRYVDAIQHARALLGDRLKVIRFDDYVKNNQQVMDEVATFIGIEPIAWQADVANRSGIPRSRWLQKLIMRKSLAKTLFVKTLPEKLVGSLKRRLMEHNTGQKPKMSGEDRRYLKSIIADEADKIWPNTIDSELLQSMYKS